MESKGRGVLDTCSLLSHSSFRGARSASPESITTTGSMDSGPAPSGASTMCNCTSGNDGVALLPISSIDRRHRKLRKVNAVDAADVERYHLGAVGLAAAREHVDAAIDAELMPDRVLVEQIFLQIVLAGAELKTLRRQEREMQPLLGADRAVAGGHHGKIGGAFETHQPAMAAAGIDLDTGHRSAPCVAVVGTSRLLKKSFCGAVGV